MSSLAIRKAVLREPANRDTREVWRASARRVDALLHLLDNNPDLVPPIQVASADVDVVVFAAEQTLPPAASDAGGGSAAPC
jgi:hypothetical protein